MSDLCAEDTSACREMAAAFTSTRFVFSSTFFAIAFMLDVSELMMKSLFSFSALMRTSTVMGGAGDGTRWDCAAAFPVDVSISSACVVASGGAGVAGPTFSSVVPSAFLAAWLWSSVVSLGCVKAGCGVLLMFLFLSCRLGEADCSIISTSGLGFGVFAPEFPSSVLVPDSGVTIQSSSEEIESKVVGRGEGHHSRARPSLQSRVAPGAPVEISWWNGSAASGNYRGTATSVTQCKGAGRGQGQSIRLSM